MCGIEDDFEEEYLEDEILDANEMLYELELAEHGDVQAQYRLAGIYADRTAVVHDVKKCAEWMRLATRNGWPQAVAVLSAAGLDASDERIFAAFSNCDGKLTPQSCCVGF